MVYPENQWTEFERAYKVKNNPKWQRLGLFVSKKPKKNILFEEAEKKKGHPAPNHYIKALNWTAESAKAKDNFQKFLKGKRVTQTDEILETRKLRLPGPQTYKCDDGYKAKVLPLS